MLEKILKTIIETIRQYDASKTIFYILPHVRADGDAIGASLALFHILRKLGFSGAVLVDEPVPSKFDFIPFVDKIKAPSAAEIAQIITTDYVAIAVDCSVGSRMQNRGQIFDQATQQIVLDHHVSSGEASNLKYIDAKASSAGEIIYDFIQLYQTYVDITLMDSDIAAMLLTAMISDTGSFSYPNTTAKTLKVASEILTYEPKPGLSHISYVLFRHRSLGNFKASAFIFSTAQFALNGKLIIGSIDCKMMQQLEIDEVDLEGIVSELRAVEGVIVSLLLRQTEDGSLRINVRSNNHFNSAQFAAAFDGGGHVNAAGMTLSNLTLEEGKVLLIESVGEQLK